MVRAELVTGPDAAGSLPGGHQPGAQLHDPALTPTPPWTAP
jgi:hypothetical protein